MELSLANLTHINCVGTPQWPTLGMVEALVCGLEGGGDKSGYIPGMCSDHSLVASYSGPNFFRLLLVHKTVWCSLSSLSIQMRVLAVTFCITLLGLKDLFKIQKKDV